MDKSSQNVLAPELTSASKVDGAMEQERQCVIGIDHVTGSGASGIFAGNQYVGRVIVSGWVVCKQLIDKMVFENGGAVIGIATIGVYRPDVGAKHPTYIESENSGFIATLSNVQWPIGSAPDVTVGVWEKGGRRHTGKLRLKVAGNSSEPMTIASRVNTIGSTLSVEAYIDAAEVDMDGGLRVRGWATAPVEIIAIQIFGNNIQLGLARTGIDRSDVASIYPNYPNVNKSGFEFYKRLDSSLSMCLHTVQVEVIARNGEARTIAIDIARIEHSSKPKIESLNNISVNTDSRSTSHIQYNCDDGKITRNGEGHLSGWVISEDGISSITLLINDAIVGVGKLGLAREDVGRSFPDIANSGFSGFEVKIEYGKIVDSDTSAELRIVDVLGYVLSTTVILKLSVSNELRGTSNGDSMLSSNDDFRMNIDSPKISSSQAIEPITGAITVDGWAVARHVLKSVHIYIDDILLGQARLGNRRPDVAALFPDWPDSLLSGFGLFVPAGVLKNGVHRLSVVLTDSRDVKHILHIQVDVKKTAIGEGDRPLRRKMPVVESEINLRILKSAGLEPHFDILLIVNDVTYSSLLLGVTLNSIRNQVYPHWRLFLLAPNIKNRKVRGELRALIAAAMDTRIDVIYDMPSSLPSITLTDGADNSSFINLRYFLNIHTGDELAVDSLLQVVLSNLGTSAADFIYGDERRQCPVTHKLMPFLKPEWSPELLLSTNYIGRFWIASNRLFEECFDTFKMFFEISDYDRVLRLTELARRIRRVPKILSERHSDQFETRKADYKALQCAMKRRGISAVIADS